MCPLVFLHPAVTRWRPCRCNCCFSSLTVFISSRALSGDESSVFLCPSLCPDGLLEFCSVRPRGFVFVFYPWTRSALCLLGGPTAAWGVTLCTFNNLEVTLRYAPQVWGFRGGNPLSLHVGFSSLFLFWNGSVAETLTTLLQLSRKVRIIAGVLTCFASLVWNACKHTDGSLFPHLVSQQKHARKQHIFMQNCLKYGV